jgi:hypothetical protein
MTNMSVNFVSHEEKKGYEVMSIKSHSPRAFQQYKELAPISLNHSIFILLNFNDKIV